MGAIARRFEDTLQKGDNRTFAIRPRHVNDRRDPPVRVSERAQEPLHPSERKVDALRMQRFETREQAFSFLRLQGFVRCLSVMRAGMEPRGS